MAPSIDKILCTYVYMLELRCIVVYIYSTELHLAKPQTVFKCLPLARVYSMAEYTYEYSCLLRVIIDDYHREIE